MKRSLRLFLLFCISAMLLGVFGCKNDTDTAGADTTLPSTGETTTPPNDNGYTEVTCQNTGGLTDVFFAKDGDLSALSLPLPHEWQLKKATSDSYTISRNGTVIGSVWEGAKAVPAGYRELKSEKDASQGLTVIHRILADPSVTDPQARYFRQYVFLYELNNTERAVSMIVHYAETNEFSSLKLRMMSMLQSICTDPKIGVLKLDKSKDGLPILILGNSFVGYNSSRIANFLQDMIECNGKTDHVVELNSRGYAAVSRGDWDSYLPAMRNGSYAAVFMCGFYSPEDVTALQPFVSACRQSGTELVIFPAHNEGYGDQAARKYPELVYLNWKAEINAMINDGVAWEEFCFNDAHQHSTPLAGYVGAHMIYRAIYGEIPSKSSDPYYPEMLSVYSKTGSLEVIDPDDILFFE